MKPYHLYYFSSPNGEHEFVVVSDMSKDDVIGKHEDEALFVSAHQIHGDCTSLPCDRALISS